MEFPGIDLAELVGVAMAKVMEDADRGFIWKRGKVQQEFLETIANVAVNHPVEVDGPFVDSVIIPDGGDQQSVTISTQERSPLVFPILREWHGMRFVLDRQSAGSTTIGSILFGNTGEIARKIIR